MSNAEKGLALTNGAVREKEREYHDVAPELTVTNVVTSKRERVLSKFIKVKLCVSTNMEHLMDAVKNSQDK